jgi:hypothetical protein
LHSINQINQIVPTSTTEQQESDDDAQVQVQDITKKFVDCGEANDKHQWSISKHQKIQRYFPKPSLGNTDDTDKTDYVFV